MTYTCNRGLKNPEYESTQQDLPDKKTGEDSGMQVKRIGKVRKEELLQKYDYK